MKEDNNYINALHTELMAICQCSQIAPQGGKVQKGATTMRF